MTVAVPKLAIHHEDVEAWRRAAELMDMRLEEWIVIVLDKAAGEALRRSDLPLAQSMACSGPAPGPSLPGPERS
jgi:hypothetical protein